MSSIDLANWINRQRTKLRKRKLSPAHIAKLKEIGIVADVHEAFWTDGISNLEQYFNDHGNVNVPFNYSSNGFNLGIWVLNRRKDKTTGKLSKQQIDLLNEFGFIWNSRDHKWQIGFQSLKNFKKREGHCRVKALHIEENFRLGAWVDRQRQNLKNNTIRPERKKKLDDLGFVWEVLG